MAKKLSIIIPCFNEEKLVLQMLQKIDQVYVDGITEKEIIVVDDASNDNTSQLLRNYNTANQKIKIITLPKNKGKGFCIRQGIQVATGDLIIIQDADLEYDPTEYTRLVKPILNGYADVVYGSRFRGGEPHRILFYFHTIGNKLLTFFSNILTQLNLTDMETGYKMFRADILKKINLKEDRFGFEPEVTAKISRIKGIRIYEVGIAYFGRGYEEGKKIKWTDGVWAIYCIIKYNIFSRN